MNETTKVFMQYLYRQERKEKYVTLEDVLDWTREGKYRHRVEAVAWKLANVINRHLHEGDKVRLKDFGLMKLEIESDKVDVPEDFKPSKHIKGVRLHFLPESAKGRPELYKKIKFEK
jgi:hypothetical protein